jgi:hypothetical protein
MEWKDTQPITVLPYNQMIWDDKEYSYYPLLACFITPNDSGVAEVIRKAKPYLKTFTGETDFSGYQGRDASYVLYQVKALYEALRNDFRLSYLSTPPRFGKGPQSILLPSEVLKQEAGCCIDLAVLFASCIERIGIDPIIFLVEQHAFPGFFVQEDVWRHDPWDYGVTQSVLLINSLIEKRLLVPFDATCVSNESFENAINHIFRTGSLKQEVFQGAINIKQLREMNITPLPK